MTGFTVLNTEPMTLGGHGRLSGMYTLSPFVWKCDEVYHLLLRAVPTRDDDPRLKIAEIWYGVGADGLRFKMDEGPLIFPGPDAWDLDGCEDPTVFSEGGTTYVWYSGLSAAENVGRLLRASGKDIRSLKKDGVVLDSTTSCANPKEATVIRSGDGRWRLFFEFARQAASHIGLVEAGGPEGPWHPREARIEARDGAWDNWHLSTGPIIGEQSEAPTMFYNGAGPAANWRIGWATYNRDYSDVIARSDQPLITPPKSDDSGTDIAFAASAVEDGDDIWLYYSLADKAVMRAHLRRT